MSFILTAALCRPDKRIPEAGVQEERGQAARRHFLREDHGRYSTQERPGQRRTDQRQGVQHLWTRRALAQTAVGLAALIIVSFFYNVFSLIKDKNETEDLVGIEL